MKWWERLKQMLRYVLPVWKQVNEASDTAREKLDEIVRD